ncbi:MAG: hypothetical protein ACP5RH_01565 [Leptodesmis sp.]|uniref:hypothetical protein n=1 Tax=Leptodesmis sp. TaxID=3100501 RepID=UPI003D13C4F6
MADLELAMALYAQKTTIAHKGSAAKFAKPGEYVWVQLKGAKAWRTLRCKAATVINSTQVSVIEADKEFYAFCETAPRMVRRTVSKFVKNRTTGQGVSANIKYLLSKTVSGVTSVWVCGWQDQCVKVLDLPTGAVGLQAVIDNQGGDNYYVTLYYSLGGQLVFQFYDQTGLLNQYTETGLLSYQLIPNYTATFNPFDIDAGLWDPNFVFAVGYGRFICNYGEDSNTTVVPFPPSSTLVQPGDVFTATKTNAIRFVIDLRSTSTTIQKNIHPTETAVRSILAGPLGTQPEDWTDKWLGLTVAASMLRTATSQIDEYLRLQAFPYRTSNSITRHVYRTNENGDVALGEMLRISKSTAPGSVYSSPDNGYFIYVNDPLNEVLYRVTDLDGNTTTNRFLGSISQYPTLSTTGIQFLDVADTGLNWIEHQQANASATPTPIPSTTLFRIERATAVKQVTVWQMDFAFNLQGSVDIDVYPPNINQGATSNFGTVLAASYGESTQGS